MKIETHEEQHLGPALAKKVATHLRAAIDTKGFASVVVPGGSTPGPFLSALKSEPLDWGKITVTLSDERCVPADHARSNQKLVIQRLLHGPAQAARFIPLYTENHGQDRIRAELIAHALPLDVCVLGMGEDMHTASLFPGTPGLNDLLDPTSEKILASVTPPNADEERVTLTVRALSAASNTYLLIKGREKRAALEQAMNIDNRETAPIRAVLENAQSPVVFYAE